MIKKIKMLMPSLLTITYYYLIVFLTLGTFFYLYDLVERNGQMLSVSLLRTPFYQAT